MAKIYPSGSEWRIWDLHVHTPASIVHNYGGDTEDVWDKYIADLESLPAEYKVLGINDYLFIDGYERLLNEKIKNERLQNIDLILPVLEFRIQKFTGIEFDKTKRINLHVIFSNEIEPATIKSQFINALQQGYQLSPGIDGSFWNGTISKEGLADLGKKIKETVPSEKLSKYGSDLHEGFRNLNLDEKIIFKILNDSSYFKGKYLTAIGKTEWDQLKWSDTSISTKKDIINSVNIVFVSAESPGHFKKAKDTLTANGVNDLLLDCSDAHGFSTDTNKDRIGNCFTWIKANPTFDGLRQIINEPEQRIFVGECPPLLYRVKQQPTRFASRLTVRKAATSTTSEIWFDQSIPLNPGLIAVIGKKGSGKSALADIFALLGNTQRFEDFSFLSNKRFREPKHGLAEQFEAELDWESGYKSGPMVLSTNPSLSDVEGVDYIPQSFLDRICNEIAEGQSDRFYRELQDVIFSHIPKAQRLNCDNLSELIQLKTEEREQAIQLLLANLKKTNDHIVEIEGRLSPEYLERLTKRYLSLFDDIRALRRDARPTKVYKPDEDVNTAQATKAISEKLDSLKRRLKRNEEHGVRITDIRDTHSLRLTNLRKLRARIKNLVDQHQAEMNDIEEIAGQVGLDAGSLVKLNVNTKLIDEAEALSANIFERANNILDPKLDASLTKKNRDLKQSIESESKKLTEPQRKYEAFLKARSNWHDRIRALIGSSSDSESARGLKLAIRELDSAPDKLKKLQDERISIVESIFAEKEELKKAYQELHEPVQAFIDQFSGTDTENNLTFAVNIQEVGFVNRFLSFIHQGRIGSFLGRKEGRLVSQQIVDRADFETVEGIKIFLKEILRHLESDLRVEKPISVEINDQLIEGVSKEKFYDFLYGLEYLKPEFEIGWAGKKLGQLSPGEKGNLLLIFYLLVDQSDRPLVIDQPEENLDNETVFRTLVPCVKEARNRRQVVLITHNPNLAVVCDADQVIHASINKSDGNKIEYITGAIEDKQINALLVDVLEGTRPAFESRDAKYEVSRF